MISKHLKLSAPLLAATLALTACESGDPLTSDDQAARLTVQITDAPGDLAEAWVRIDKVLLLQSGQGEGESGQRVELTPKSAEWINLLTLAGGKVADLVTETVEPGTYGQLRMVVCNMYIKTRSGQIIATPGADLPAGVTPSAGGELKLTSQCKSGFKVNFAGEGIAVDEGSTTLVVDFDVAQSFVHQAGRSGKWIVKPTLHGVRKEKDGAIRGTVALQNVTLPVACGGESLTQSALLAKVVPTATAGATVRTGTTTGQGEFKIAHLAPDTYTLGVDKLGFANGDTLSFAATASPASVQVETGVNASAAYTVTAATCKAKG